MNRSRKKKYLNKNGFSLLEMTVALALISILASIAIMGFHQYRERINLRTVARQIQADINNTKMMAQSKSKKFQITYSKDEAKYSIYRIKDDDVTWETVREIPLNTSEISGISFDFEGEKSIEFQPRGTIGVQTITIKGSNDIAADITTNLNGRVYVSFP